MCRSDTPRASRMPPQLGAREDLGQLRRVARLLGRRERQHRRLGRQETLGRVVGLALLLVAQHLVGLAHAHALGLGLGRLQQRVGRERPLAVELEAEAVGALDLVARGARLEPERGVEVVARVLPGSGRHALRRGVSSHGRGSRP